MIEVLVVLLVAVVVFVVAVSIVKQSRSKEENDFVYDTSDGELHPHKWGYTDTRFEFESPTRIRLTGTRYLLAGYSMPYFIPFVEEMLQVPINSDEMAVEKEDCDVISMRFADDQTENFLGEAHPLLPYPFPFRK